nr:MAG TPA: hypothetical protein [Caudoviricetes sp.]
MAVFGISRAGIEYVKVQEQVRSLLLLLLI